MERGEKDLATMMDKKRAGNVISPSKLRLFWEQMLEAVHEVHKANIIHSDIKPANFLLVAGDLKIIDFGLACKYYPGQDYVIKNGCVGTKDYMSPELLSSFVIEDGVVEKRKEVKVTTKSDIWALGIILYIFVYGSGPFSNVPGGKLSRLKILASDDYPVEFEEMKDLDPMLVDTMKKCLHKDPEKRSTIEELLSHPYLRPDHVEKIQQPNAFCPSCDKVDNKHTKQIEEEPVRLKNKEAKEWKTYPEQLLC